MCYFEVRKMRFQFLYEYFKKSKINDFENDIHIEITETPSFNISEEDYSLRIETCSEGDIHRDYAVEHHLGQKHEKPHLQFKFHSEKIGSIWINLLFEDEAEYKEGIEGFIFHSKNIFLDLESEHENLCEELMYVEKVDKLEAQGKFLQTKITKSIVLGLTEFKNCTDQNRVQLIKNHELLNIFIGEHNVLLLLDDLPK